MALDNKEKKANIKAGGDSNNPSSATPENSSSETLQSPSYKATELLLDYKNKQAEENGRLYFNTLKQNEKADSQFAFDVAISAVKEQHNNNFKALNSSFFDFLKQNISKEILNSEFDKKDFKKRLSAELSYLPEKQRDLVKDYISLRIENANKIFNSEGTRFEAENKTKLLEALKQEIIDDAHINLNDKNIPLNLNKHFGIYQFKSEFWIVPSDKLGGNKEYDQEVNKPIILKSSSELAITNIDLKATEAIISFKNIEGKAATIIDVTEGGVLANGSGFSTQTKDISEKRKLNDNVKPIVKASKFADGVILDGKIDPTPYLDAYQPKSSVTVVTEKKEFKEIKRPEWITKNQYGTSYLNPGVAILSTVRAAYEQSGNDKIFQEAAINRTPELLEFYLKAVQQSRLQTDAINSEVVKGENDHLPENKGKPVKTLSASEGGPAVPDIKKLAGIAILNIETFLEEQRKTDPEQYKKYKEIADEIIPQIMEGAGIDEDYYQNNKKGSENYFKKLSKETFIWVDPFEKSSFAGGEKTNAANKNTQEELETTIGKDEINTDDKLVDFYYKKTFLPIEVKVNPPTKLEIWENQNETADFLGKKKNIPGSKKIRKPIMEYGEEVYTNVGMGVITKPTNATFLVPTQNCVDCNPECPVIAPKALVGEERGYKTYFGLRNGSVGAGITYDRVTDKTYFLDEKNTPFYSEAKGNKLGLYSVYDDGMSRAVVGGKYIFGKNGGGEDIYLNNNNQFYLLPKTEFNGGELYANARTLSPLKRDKNSEPSLKDNLFLRSEIETSYRVTENNSKQYFNNTQFRITGGLGVNYKTTINLIGNLNVNMYAGATLSYHKGILDYNASRWDNIDQANFKMFYGGVKFGVEVDYPYKKSISRKPPQTIESEPQFYARPLTGAELSNPFQAIAKTFNNLIKDEDFSLADYAQVKHAIDNSVDGAKNPLIKAVNEFANKQGKTDKNNYKGDLALKELVKQIGKLPIKIQEERTPLPNIDNRGEVSSPVPQ